MAELGCDREARVPVTYQFTFARTLEQEVRSAWLDQVVKAEKRLSKADDPESAVHGLRKTLKRIRALIRLVAPGLPGRIAQLENRRYRDLGRALSAVRDRQVLAETLEHLAAATGRGEAPAFTAARKTIRGGARDEAGSLDLVALQTALADARKAAEAIPFAQLRDRHLVASYASAYREGRKLMRRVRSTGDVNASHDWRKAAQRHWRQSVLLCPAWPQELAARASCARAISDRLGIDHDLDVLVDHLRASVGEGTKKRDARELESEAAALQKALRRDAFSLGARLYAWPSRAVESAAERWLEAARRDARDVRERSQDRPALSALPLRSADLDETLIGR